MVASLELDAKLDVELKSKLEAKNLLSIVYALPDEFSFYHLGEVKKHGESHTSHPTPTIDFTQHTAIAFQVYGDLQAWVMLLVAHELDSSLYAELGNILVSQLVTQLDATQGIGVMTSPPHFLNSTQAKKLLFHSHHRFHKTYLHHLNRTAPTPLTIPIETWILLNTQEEGGHA